MERLTCNELKTIRDGFFIHKGNRKDGAKYRMLAESSPKYEEIYRKLAEYEDAEEQGLLLRLPCKVGDTVYCLTSGNTKIFDCTVLWIEKHQNGVLVFSLDGGLGDVVLADLGKKWFATYEEAELELTNRLQLHAEAIMDERNGR